MENNIEEENFKRLYNTLDWIDLGLIGVICFYYIRLWNRLEFDLLNAEELDFVEVINLVIENTNLVGIVLLLVSLAVTITFIYLTVKMRRKRFISGIRAGVRLIWNGTFLLIDIYALLLIFIFRITG